MNDMNNTSGSPSIMGGLLDWLGTPAGQGLLAAAGAGFAGARRGQPLNAFGSGLLGGLQGYNLAQQQQLTQTREATQNKLADIQLKQAQQGQSDQDAIRVLAQKYYTAPSMTMDQVMSAPGQAGPTVARTNLLPQTQGKFDTQGFINGVMGIDPIKGMQFKASMAKELPFNKIDPKDFSPESVARFAQSGNYGDLVPARKMELTPGGQVWNPYQATPGQTYQDPNQLFSIGLDGKPVPNTALQTFELEKAKAGRPTTSVLVNNKMGEGVAAQVGPIMKESYDAASGAQQQIANADRLISAVESGKAFTGPGASFKLGAAQLGQMMGIGGKDAADQILNTRAAIQGLAQSTLAARSSLKGQGQVSDYEGKLIERAASGDIDSLTGPEIKQLAMINKRLSQQIVAQHKVRVNKLLGHDSTAGIADMYDLSDLPSASGNTIDFGSLK